MKRQKKRGFQKISLAINRKEIERTEKGALLYSSQEELAESSSETTLGIGNRVGGYSQAPVLFNGSIFDPQGKKKLITIIRCFNVISPDRPGETPAPSPPRPSSMGHARPSFDSIAGKRYDRHNAKLGHFKASNEVEGRWD